MNDFYQSLTAAGQSNINNCQAMTEQMIGGVEQVGRLNLTVSKAVMGESMQQMQSMLELRDPQQFMAMQAGMVQPMAEKSASYLRQMYEILSRTNVEIGKLAEGQMKEVQQTFTSMLDAAMKNAPAGTEAATAMFRNAVDASQSAIASAQNAARQAMTTTEQNAVAMSDQAMNTVRATSTRNKR